MDLRGPEEERLHGTWSPKRAAIVALSWHRNWSADAPLRGHLRVCQSAPENVHRHGTRRPLAVGLSTPATKLEAQAALPLMHRPVMIGVEQRPEQPFPAPE